MVKWINVGGWLAEIEVDVGIDVKVEINEQGFDYDGQMEWWVIGWWNDDKRIVMVEWMVVGGWMVDDRWVWSNYRIVGWMIDLGWLNDR